MIEGLFDRPVPGLGVGGALRLLREAFLLEALAGLLAASPGLVLVRHEYLQPATKRGGHHHCVTCGRRPVTLPRQGGWRDSAEDAAVEAHAQRRRHNEDSDDPDDRQRDHALDRLSGRQRLDADRQAAHRGRQH